MKIILLIIGPTKFEVSTLYYDRLEHFDLI